MSIWDEETPISEEDQALADFYNGISLQTPHKGEFTDTTITNDQRED
jgi:hypothetical protein